LKRVDTGEDLAETPRSLGMIIRSTVSAYVTQQEHSRACDKLSNNHAQPWGGLLKRKGFKKSFIADEYGYILQDSRSSFQHFLQRLARSISLFFQLKSSKCSINIPIPDVAVGSVKASP
jgi:hypothetical protein